MADLRFNIVGKDTVTKSIKGLGGIVGGIAGKVGGLVKSVFSLRGAVGAISVGAILKDFASVQKGVAEITTLMDEVSEETAPRLQEQIQKTARTVGVAMGSLVKARYDIVSAGFNDVTNSLQVMDASAKLAVAGVTDVAGAADLLTTALNAYGKEATEATDVTDILLKTVKQGKTTITQMSGVFGDVLPTASAVGLKLEGVGAALAAMTSRGINTAKSVVSLNGLLMALAAPTDDAKKSMKELGIEVKRFDDGSLDLVETVKQFRNLSFEQIKDIIPNRRATKGVLTLAQNFKVLEQNILEMQNRAGTTKFMTDIMNKTFSLKMVKLKENVMTGIRTIGKAMAETLTPYVDKLNDELGQLGDIGWENIGKSIVGNFSEIMAAVKEIVVLTFRSFVPIAKEAFIALGKVAMTALKLGMDTIDFDLVSIMKGSRQKDNLKKLMELYGTEAAIAFAKSGKWEDLGIEVKTRRQADKMEEIFREAGIDIGVNLGQQAYEESKEWFDKITSGVVALPEGMNMMDFIGGTDAELPDFSTVKQGIGEMMSALKFGDYTGLDFEIAIEGWSDYSTRVKEIIKNLYSEIKTEAAILNTDTKVQQEQQVDNYEETLNKEMEVYEKATAARIAAADKAWEKGEKQVEEHTKNMTQFTEEWGKTMLATAIQSEQGIKSYGKTLRQITRQTIKALIAEGVAHQVKGALSKYPPPFGLVIAAGAGAAAASLFESAIPKFALGGNVVASTGQQDSVTARLMIGESVNTKDTTQRFGSEINRLNQLAQGGAGVNDGGTVNIYAIDKQSILALARKQPSLISEVVKIGVKNTR